MLVDEDASLTVDAGGSASSGGGPYLDVILQPDVRFDATHPQQ
jgi:hypothetical protein